nr:tryptophan 7-halogenase [Aliiglaciecola lipolytica]
MNKSIIILGGGTAGWMCANLLQHALGKFGFNITLIESPEIGIIGVGEGSTPHLRNFFSILGISESQWMPKCNATYKNGISFDGWSQQQGYDNYFHPFPSLPDRQTAGGFLINCHLRRQGHQVDSHPNQYFLAAHLSKNNLSPKPKGHSPIRINYGYHFDSALLGSFLKDFAIKQGVTHVTAKIEHVEQHLSGDIAHLMSDQGETFSANWFVDCSGFTSKLLQQTLKSLQVTCLTMPQ